jgi:AP-3 complex subunit sigma
MIKGIIIVNNHGKPRLVKFYQPVASDAMQQSVIRRIFQQVSSRPDSFCNYLETMVCPEWGGYEKSSSNQENSSSTSYDYSDDTKLIYRHYATLYFCVCVDRQESDLGILDLIQVFVEALDKAFGNVCELDLIFHSDRVHYILDEIVMGGMVLETNIHAVLQATKDQDQKHQESLAPPLMKSAADTANSSSQTAKMVQQLGGGLVTGTGGSMFSDQPQQAQAQASTWSYNW